MFLKLKNNYASILKATLVCSALTVASACSMKTDAGQEGEGEAKTPKDDSKKNQNVINQSEEKTNIVYIVLDDSGFSDLGSYGSEIKTPNLDKLAENGLRYNNFHVSPLSSPTRAALLTGRNAHTVGMGTVANFDFGPDYPNRRGAITPEAGTVAEVLAESDYKTYALGKWHLAPTEEATPAGPYHNWPLGKGFQRYYGFLEDSADQYKPELTQDNSPVPAPDNENYHLSEDLIEKANQYVLDKVSVSPDNPFFMYLGFGAPHMPHQVPQEYIEMYKGVYDDGWDKIREDRFKKQKELGIIPENTKLPHSNEGVQEWASLSEDEKRVFIRLKETYAGFLTHADEQIGKFINHLEEKGELDNTMIFLFSDNGASSIGGQTGSTNHTLAYNFISEDIDSIVAKIDDMGSEKAGTEYPAGWAQVSNTPFRFYKNGTYAGGTRTPLIVHWPKGIKEKGEIREQYVNVSDVTTTVYDILGIEPPETINGVDQMPLHGSSFAATFKDGQAAETKTTQYFEASGQRAIYHDGWRAIARHTKSEPFEDDIWELYHIDEDFNETNDLAEQEPEKLQEMIDLWEQEAKKYGVYPLSDLFIEAFNNIPENSLRARNEFTYYPGMTHLGDSASPPILNRSYSIDIPITFKQSDDGVLVALGNHESGYTLYIKDNHLVYEYNNGLTRYKITSAQPLNEGELDIQFEFVKTGNLEGEGILYVNEEKVGEEVIDRTLPYKTSFEGMDIGKDALYPVSLEYADKGMFPYTGEIEKVVFTMKSPVEQQIQ